MATLLRVAASKYSRSQQELDAKETKSKLLQETNPAEKRKWELETQEKQGELKCCKTETGCFFTVCQEGITGGHNRDQTPKTRNQQNLKQSRLPHLYWVYKTK